MVGYKDYKFSGSNEFTIPLECKKDINGDVVIVRKNDRCLTVYPILVFQKLLENKTVLPSYDEIFSSPPVHTKVSSGKIILSDEDISFLGIKHHYTMFGFCNHLEIWDSEKFEIELSNSMPIEEIMDILGGHRAL